MGLLRFYLALCVLLGHIGVHCFISPIYAVQGFYIISGFYISLILNERYKTPTNNSTFYKKRFLRLMPTYWVIALLSLLVALCYYHHNESNILFFDFNHFPSQVSIFTLLYIYITNIIAWGQDLAFFLCISPENGNMFFSSLSFADDYPLARYLIIPVSWSISTEISFYLIAPFILRKKHTLVFCIFMLSVASNILTNLYGFNNSSWRFRFFPSTLTFFLTGYYAYLIYDRLQKQIIDTNYKYIVLFLDILLITSFLHMNNFFAIHECILLFIEFISIPYLYYAFKNNTTDRSIGELSYPLYLIHPLFIGIDELCGIHSKPFIIMGSIFGAYCCLRYWIIPIEKLRSKIH